MPRPVGRPSSTLPLPLPGQAAGGALSAPPTTQPAAPAQPRPPASAGPSALQRGAAAVAATAAQAGRSARTAPRIEDLPAGFRDPRMVSISRERLAELARMEELVQRAGGSPALHQAALPGPAAGPAGPEPAPAPSARPPATAGGATTAAPPDPTEQVLREAEEEAERRSAPSQAPPEVSWGISCMAPSTTVPMLAWSPPPSTAPTRTPVVPTLLPSLPAASVGLVGRVAPPLVTHVTTPLPAQAQVPAAGSGLRAI